jgi:DNA-binding protein H-NS
LGWAKTIGGMAQTVYRGVERVRSRFILTMAANNLARLPGCWPPDGRRWRQPPTPIASNKPTLNAADQSQGKLFRPADFFSSLLKNRPKAARDNLITLPDYGELHGGCDIATGRLSRMHHSGHEGQMADFNLEALSLKELRQLQKDLAKAIATYQDRQKAEARAKLEAIAKDMGYSLADVVGVELKTTRAAPVAKYRHPENATLTWSGRGRRPQWFADQINAGRDPSALAI